MATLSRAVVRLCAVSLLLVTACTPAPSKVPPVPARPTVEATSGSGVAPTRVGSPSGVGSPSAHHAGSGGGSAGHAGQGSGGGSNAGGVPGDPAVVVSTVDGDTIHVRYRGRELDVRLIGIDTPETVDPSQPVQCYGEAASRSTAQKLTGRRINLEFDVERHDRYGRTLAYVWLRGRLFNRRLVADGYATVSTYPPDVRYVRLFEAAQRAARRAHRGLWHACAGGGTGGHRCDPAYPDVCIPSPPPDLDCSDIRFRNFRVLPPDPHNFDGDHNGRGCET